jgi:hypothetical protein
MSLEAGAKREWNAASIVTNLVQDISPPGSECIHIELVYVFQCHGPVPGRRLCEYAMACRHIRLPCSGCGKKQAFSGEPHDSGSSKRPCNFVNEFVCKEGEVHTLNLTSRKFEGMRVPVRGKYISGVDVQLNRILVTGVDKLNNWDSYLVAPRTTETDGVILEFAQGFTRIIFSDGGANRYNYMSVLFNLCQLFTNPTAYYGRGRPCVRLGQCACWVLCCCVTDKTNPFFPDYDTVKEMPVEWITQEKFTCSTLVHVILLRLGVVAEGDGGILFGSVHPGQLVALVKGLGCPMGLLHDLVHAR